MFQNGPHKATDPYVSNPLRQARVVPNPPNVRPNTLPFWEALHEVLSDAEGVRSRIRLMWSRGINLYNATIEELVLITLSLAGEESRLEFIAEVGKQLDEFARPSGKASWRDLLESILDGTELA